jgi:hypothetical protein
MQTFFSGDSYIILNKRKNTIYFWVGEESTVDEVTSAAILAVHLDGI